MISMNEAIDNKKDNPTMNVYKHHSLEEKEAIIRMIREEFPEGDLYWTYKSLDRIIKINGKPVSHHTINRILKEEIGTFQIYCIGGHNFSIQIEATSSIILKLSHYQLFRNEATPENKPLFHLSITKKHNLEIPDFIKQDIKQNVYFSEGALYLVDRNEKDGSPLTILKTNKTFTQGKLSIINDPHLVFTKANILRMYSICTNTLKTIALHAAVVEYKQKSYLFLGKSGTGKSTHCRLWIKNIPGARIINDDQPVVRIHSDGTVWVYGTPWGGKSPKYCNEQYPIGGFVILAQAPINEIHNASGYEAYSSLWTSIIHYHPWENNNNIQDFIVSIINSVPFWHFNCLPDDNAAILCCKTITNHQHII